jgi:hypothetical protein
VVFTSLPLRLISAMKLTNKQCVELSQSDEVWAVRAIYEKDDETGEPLYWHNEFGWTSGEICSLFTAQDHAELNLPIGGMWEKW